MTEGMVITMIGAGEIGRSLGHILMRAGHTVRFWDKNPTALAGLGSAAGDLPEIIPHSAAIFLCLPSWAIRDALVYLLPYLQPKTIIVSLAKGLEGQSGCSLAELLEKNLPKKNPYAILGGPLLAEEVKAGKPGLAYAGISQAAAGDFLERSFTGSTVSVYLSLDPASVAFLGVLKNVYALAFGLADGLEWGNNTRGVLTTVALEEMKKIMRTLNLSVNLVSSPAGMGDLVATGTSERSHNRQAGFLLALGQLDDKKSEGEVSLLPLARRLGPSATKLPLFSFLNDTFATREVSPDVFHHALYGQSS